MEPTRLRRLFDRLRVLANARPKFVEAVYLVVALKWRQLRKKPPPT